MSVDEATFSQLVDMGIDPPLARAAAIRFSTAEAAINWCFGEGANWTPGNEKDVLPNYERHGSPSSNTTLFPPPPQRHAASPRLPPRPQFGSNSPFRDTPPSPSPTVHEDDDAELQKAIELSRAPVNPPEEMTMGENDEDRRDERERSVRASGVPPPSPQSEEGEVTQTLFVPSNKDDVEGKLAMVPASQPQGPNNEDEDLNRAIADSLMTASFHSTSAQREVEKVSPVKRTPEAPLVLYSESGDSTYAANLLQGLLAIPQLREAIAASVVSQVDDPGAYIKITGIQELCMRMDKEESSFLEVDSLLRELRKGMEPDQLPPTFPTEEFFLLMMHLLGGMLHAAKLDPKTNEDKRIPDYWSEPKRMFVSDINSDINSDTSSNEPTTASFVQFNRSSGSPLELYGALSQLLWTNESPAQSIETLSDIQTVKITWGYGAPRQLWKLQNRIVLDRFLRENLARTMQIRGEQGVAAGNAKRIKAGIDSLTYHRGDNVHESITTLMKFLENAPTTDDPVRTESRRELKEKLKTNLELLQKRTSALNTEMEQEEEKSHNAAFDTDDPELNRHSFLLRAVLMYDGAVVAGDHLFVYVRQEDDSWWRIKRHEATKVEWSEIESDRTGLYMDGGPYWLLYSRDGPRPPSSISEPEMESTEHGPAENKDMNVDETPPQQEDALHGLFTKAKEENLISLDDEQTTETVKTSDSADATLVDVSTEPSQAASVDTSGETGDPLSILMQSTARPPAEGPSLGKDEHEGETKDENML